MSRIRQQRASGGINSPKSIKSPTIRDCKYCEDNANIVEVFGNNAIFVKN